MSSLLQMFTVVLMAFVLVEGTVPTQKRSLVSLAKNTILTKQMQQLKHMIKKSKGTRIMSMSEWKKNWCTRQKFNQTVSHKNCISVTIANYYCYGQCNSIYVPGNHKALQTCLKCSPKSYIWKYVELKCPLDKENPKRLKKVQLIHSCGCNSC